MDQTKYQKLFGLLLNNKSGITIELPEADLKNTKSALSKLKAKYNQDNLSIPETYRPDNITGIITYKIDKEAKPSSPEKVVLTISIQQPKPLDFKIIG